MKVRAVWEAVKSAATGFIEDNVMSLSAALSFYSILSLAPLLMIVVTVAGFVGENTEVAMVRQVKLQIGHEGGEAIGTVLKNARSQRRTGVISAIIGGATLLFSAAGVFAQLQWSLNCVWNIRVKAGGAMTAWLWVRHRLLGFGMVLIIAALLMASTAASAILPWVLPDWSPLWAMAEIGISLAVYVVMFAMLYKTLPDAHIAWSDVWIGAALTAVLFTLGKFAIARYLAYSTVVSAYGAAGSLVALLVWVYYSALILLFGAELTQAYAAGFGRKIKPKSYAVSID